MTTIITAGECPTCGAPCIVTFSGSWEPRAYCKACNPELPAPEPDRRALRQRLQSVRPRRERTPGPRKEENTHEPTGPEGPG